MLLPRIEIEWFATRRKDTSHGWMYILINHVLLLLKWSEVVPSALFSGVSIVSLPPAEPEAVYSRSEVVNSAALKSPAADVMLWYSFENWRNGSCRQLDTLLFSYISRNLHWDNANGGLEHQNSVVRAMQSFYKSEPRLQMCRSSGQSVIDLSPLTRSFDQFQRFQFVYLFGKSHSSRHPIHVKYAICHCFGVKLKWLLWLYMFCFCTL